MYEIDIKNQPNIRSARRAIQVYPPNTPLIYGIKPSSVVASIGPQAIDVTGHNFSEGVRLTVFYGDLEIASYTGSQLSNVTTNTLSFAIDFLGGSGSYALEVVNPDGQKSPRFGFSAQPGDLTPHVVAISPSNPLASSLQSIKITGNNFLDGLAIDMFRNGTALSHVSGSLVTVSSATSLTFSYDFNGQAGSYGIELASPDGHRSARFSFTVQATGIEPLVSSVTPSAPVAFVIEQPLTIVGAGFQSGASVDFFREGVPFATVSGTKVSSLSDGSLVALVDFKGSGGAYGLEVVNPGNVRSRRFEFTVQEGAPPPAITGMDPRLLAAKEGFQEIHVSGTGFQPGMLGQLTLPGTINSFAGPYEIVNITPESLILKIDFQGKQAFLSLMLTNPDGRKSIQGFTFCACSDP